MMKLLLHAVIILLFASLSGEAQVIDRVVGKIGGEVILLSDIETRVAYIKDVSGTAEEGTDCFVLQDLIAQKLLINQAALDSVLVLDEEIEVQLDARINQILAAMDGDESRFEAYYGKTVSEVRDEQRENIRNQILTDRMRAQIMSAVEATPAEVEEFFHSIPKDSLPFFNSEVEVSELVYIPPYNQESRQKAIDRLEGLIKRITEEGEDFAEIASIYSNDRGSARKGGDLGWQTRGTFVPEFEAAAFNLEVGEYSEIVETQFGYHLLQLLERLGNRIHLRHILIKPEYEYEDLEKAEVFLDSLRRQIEMDSLDFETAVRIYGDEDEQSYNNGGRTVNPKTGNTFFEVGDLDSDIYFAIEGLDAGDVSEPIKFDEISGDVKFRLFFLNSRTRPHQASLESDYSRIKDIASEQKRGRMFQKWLLDRAETTFIEIDALYDDCPNLEFWLSAE